jgi:hypothetical protein
MIAWMAGHFIPEEVAIHSQVDNIFKMSWSSHAITKFAQNNPNPTEQALNNVSGRECTTICTWRAVLRVPSFYLDAPAVRQVVHYHPLLQPRHQLQLVSRIAGSDVFHPVSSLNLAPR